MMHGWTASHYPWARPARSGTGGSNDFGDSNIPEVGSFVWVSFERRLFKKNAYYHENVELEGLHPHSLFLDNIKSSIESASSYPNTKYHYYKNKICIGVDSSDSNPEIFISHPTGSFFIVDKDGNLKGTIVKDIDLKIQSNLKLDVTENAEIDITGDANFTVSGNTTLDTTGTTDITSSGAITIDSSAKVEVSGSEVEIKGGDSSTEKTVLGEKLDLAFTLLMNALDNFKLITPVGPTISLAPNTISQLQLVKVQLEQILSQKVKNN